MRKQRKGYTTILSNDESEEEIERDQVRKFVAFTDHTIEDVTDVYTTVANSSNCVDIRIPTDDDDELYDEVHAHT